MKMWMKMFIMALIVDEKKAFCFDFSLGSVMSSRDSITPIYDTLTLHIVDEKKVISILVRVWLCSVITSTLSLVYLVHTLFREINK